MANLLVGIFSLIRLQLSTKQQRKVRGFMFIFYPPKSLPKNRHSTACLPVRGLVFWEWSVNPISLWTVCWLVLCNFLSGVVFSQVARYCLEMKQPYGRTGSHTPQISYRLSVSRSDEPGHSIHEWTRVDRRKVPGLSQGRIESLLCTRSLKELVPSYSQ